MSSEITTPASEPVTCPYCSSEQTKGYFDDCNGHRIKVCTECNLPFVTLTQIIVQTTIHKIEGVEPIVETPVIPNIEEVQKEIDEHTFTCFGCGEQFVSEFNDPYRIKGEIHCPSCVDKALDFRSGTQPDDDKFLCQQCGTLNDTRAQYTSDDGLKICASSNDQKDRSWTDDAAAVEREQIADSCEKKLEYVNVSGNVFAALSGETIHLKYKDNYLDAWDISIFDVLADMDEANRRNEIDKLIAGMKYGAQRRTCLNQVVSVLENGGVEFFGGDV